MVNWQITDIVYVDDIDGLEKVAVDIHFYASYEEDGKFNFCYGNCPLDTDNLNTDSFTEFDDITKDEALEWLFDKLKDDKTEIEYNLTKNIKEWGVAPRKLGLPSSW